MRSRDLRTRVLQAYREVMRSARATFKDDTRNITNSHAFAKSQFLSHKDETDPAKIEELINLAIQAAEFIKKNVVQGIEVPREDHRGVFSLQIDSNKEINDNERKGRR